ncbi:MAG: gliding motility-associated C-terminal domain-containing protein, partial [Bacteroidota bacterium]
GVTVPPLFLDNSDVEDVDCNGAANGSWTVSVDGGLSPFTFTFDNGTVLQSNDGEVTINDLSGGPISVTITDSANPAQEVIVNEMIEEPGPIQLMDVQILPETQLNNNGAINLMIEGGMLPYSYQWNNGFMGPSPQGLNEDCYSLTIVDGNNCVAQFNDICVPLFAVSSTTITDVLCASDENGAILAEISGGINTPLTYSWEGPDGPIAINDNEIEDLPSGEYTLIVTDALGVSTVATTVTVEAESDLMATAQVNSASEFNGFGVSCPGAEDGVIEGFAVNGTPPYTYQWNGLGFGALQNEIGAGNYALLVTDDVGCQDTTSVQVTEPAPITLEADVLSISCAGDNDGEIELIVFGGVPGLSYQWDDRLSQQSNPAIFLEPGDYNVTVTDGNNCTGTESFFVASPPTLTLEFMVTPDNGSQDGTATAVPAGGTPPYSYEWNITGNNSGPVIAGQRAGEFSVRITDANGCQIVGQVTVPDGTIECLEYRNVITPDGDGFNETLVIQCLELYEDHLLEIYDRWGQLVFTTTQYDNTWNGLDMASTELPEGAYFFVFQYRKNDGSLAQVKGHITLLR